MGQVDHTPDWRLAVALAITIGVAIVVPAAWSWALVDRLPHEVARHWGTGGSVTGTWSLAAQTIALGGTTLVVAGAMAVIAVVARMPLSMRRMLAGSAAWLAVLLAAAQLDALRGHLDLADPFSAPAPSMGLGLGALIGVVAGVIVARFGRESADGVVATEPPSVDLPRLDGRTPLREITAPSSTTMTVATVAVGVSFAVLAVPAGWWLLVVGLVIMGVMHIHTRFVVTIDEHGLTVANSWFTILHVPVEEVAGGDVADEVDPFWEFGGWGLRVDVHGRTGIVTRKGSALRVSRADGSEIIITIEQAQHAAATLNTYADARFAT